MILDESDPSWHVGDSDWIASPTSRSRVSWDGRLEGVLTAAVKMASAQIRREVRCSDSAPAGAKHCRRLRCLRACCSTAAPMAAAGVPGAEVSTSTMAVTVLQQFDDGGTFGARIDGVDLASLKPGEQEALRSAYLEHVLLYIPGQQHIRPADEVAFYRAIVPCIDDSIDHSASRIGIPDAPELACIGHAELDDHWGISGTINPTGQAPQWHPDGGFSGSPPPPATQLFCVETPAISKGNGQLHWPNGSVADYEGGATCFADCRLAYRMLSPEARRLAKATNVVYWKGGVFGRTDIDITGATYPRMDPVGLRALNPPL